MSKLLDICTTYIQAFFKTDINNFHLKTILKKISLFLENLKTFEKIVIMIQIYFKIPHKHLKTLKKSLKKILPHFYPQKSQRYFMFKIAKISYQTLKKKHVSCKPQADKVERKRNS